MGEALAIENDHDLVRRAQFELPEGTAAFDELVRRYRDHVQRRSRRILGSTEEAEDAAQEVFLNVFRALPRYRPDQPFVHWLERIVSNACRMQLRRRGREARRTTALALAQGRRSQPPDLGSRLEASRLLGRISEPSRSALLLRASDHRYPEIADHLGISESAAKMRVKRGREQARALISV